MMGKLTSGWLTQLVLPLVSSVALVIEFDLFGQSFGLHQGPSEDSRRSKLLNFLVQNRHSIMLIIFRWAFRLYWYFEDNGSIKILTLIAI